MLLALDTTLTACSAALFDDRAGVVIGSRFEAMERGHAEALGPMVESLFAETGRRPAQLSRIAVTVGPGTFTGLRIGLSYAKGMALALGIPLLGLNSLLATAAPHFGLAGIMLVAHQAGGTGLFYWARFDGTTGAELSPPSIDTGEVIAAAIGQEECSLTGTGTDALQRLIPTAKLLPGPNMPVAAAFAVYAAGLPSDKEPVEPLYLRPPDAKPSVSADASSAHVREVKEHDVASLVAIHRESFPRGWNAEELSGVLAIPGAAALVVELAGTVYGFVQFQWVAGEAEINTICVSPNYRRQHFGRDLMTGLVAHLQTRGTSRLFLEVAENNTAARKLYESFGFKTSGVRKGYYSDGQNAVTMVKEMAA